MTTETDVVEIRRRLELLKLARHLINDEYLKQRADAYTKWTTDSDHAWKTQGVKLPFPPVPAMPSEADVVARALQLYNHVNNTLPPAEVSDIEISNQEEPVVETPAVPSEETDSAAAEQSVSEPDIVYVDQVKKIFEEPVVSIEPPLDQAVEDLVQEETDSNQALVPMIRGLIEKGFLQLGHRLGGNKKTETI
jgi:hypothetical protein